MNLFKANPCPDCEHDVVIAGHLYSTYITCARCNTRRLSNWELEVYVPPNTRLYRSNRQRALRVAAKISGRED